MRRTVFLTLNGQTLPLTAWAELLGIKESTIRLRKIRGASDCEALSLRHGKKEYIEYNGQDLPLVEWGRLTGIKKTTLRHRLRAGWPIKKVLTKGAKS